MLKCAILDDYQGRAVELANWASLSNASVTSITEYLPSFESRAARLAEFDVIVAMRERTPFDAALLKALPKLKLLITTGMYNASIDLEAAAELKITVCGTHALVSPAPELAWGLLLALVRHIPGESAALRADGKWQTALGTGLSGKTLGIVGLGAVGENVARFAQAFDMKVLAWSPRLSSERASALGVERADSLTALLATSDVVTIHAKLTDETRGLLGANELALLKPTAFLLNTSRGPIVDESALVTALSQNRIAGAGIDVYDQEPLPSDHPFRCLPNVVATPHIGYVTVENYQLFYQDAVEDIAMWNAGSPIRQLLVAPHSKGRAHGAR
ncbi:MAG: D-2-hydroxyacid dehydrogenase family protein [Edaphobacter sp.]|uniref:D-2-hydroxyacid dehydrogenase family protein n=1 Tax=Edaphobacter sp. TaxID=1934404 RepID=UPI0023971B53|nr:D-2-hydroxyacid dehydrogenase family protein [Edaphobacter sp.]MDE1175697.1 D-2-hydroxyacid dehydrogenase family protein [Edaphobacter sp.]